jgi:hypothetical protein
MAAHYTGAKLDYWMLCDTRRFYIDDQNWQQNAHSVKFFGRCADWQYRSMEFLKMMDTPDNTIAKYSNVYEFYWCSYYHREMCRDVETTPISSLFGSSVFVALSIILYMKPKKIYLVGCDMSNDGNYLKTESDSGFDFSHVKKGWEKFKKFTEIYHPDLEIISVNPVGLKDMFIDIYQNL